MLACEVVSRGGGSFARIVHIWTWAATARGSKGHMIIQAGLGAPGDAKITCICQTER